MPYPAEIETLQTVATDSPRVLHANNHNAANRAIEALEAKLGTGGGEPDDGYILRGSGPGASFWATNANLVETLANSGLIVGKATVTLSSADILDLHNTPVELVAAPGAGKVAYPQRFIAFYQFGTTAYATDDGDPVVALGNAYNVDMPIALSGLTADNTTAAPTANLNDATSAYEDVPITVRGNGTLTLGDGTLTVTVYYSIEDVP